ncbi:MAG: bile acid:sodium symporter [Acidimicrobiia bacterium]|nr:bile acid:sodium symporter [Acidimicrobiia bacterium]
METILFLLNVVFLVFIVSTMLSVGLGTTVPHLVKVLNDVRWLGGALVASLIAVPLIGWGLAEVFPLEGPSYIALILVASSPGAPFAVALATMQRGDVLPVAATMAILAVIGSITTALTVSLILGAGDVAEAEGGAIDIGELLLSIVVLQIVPFLVGMAVRAWVPATADGWASPAKRVSTITFGLVLAGVVIVGIPAVIDLIGSWIIPAALVAALAWIAAGALLAPSPRSRRVGAGLLASSRNAGPVLLIASVAFADVEGVIPAIIAVYLVLLVTGALVAAWFGKQPVAADT